MHLEPFLCPQQPGQKYRTRWWWDTVWHALLRDFPLDSTADSARSQVSQGPRGRVRSLGKSPPDCLSPLVCIWTLVALIFPCKDLKNWQQFNFLFAQVTIEPELLRKLNDFNRNSWIFSLLRTKHVIVWLFRSAWSVGYFFKIICVIFSDIGQEANH